MESDGEDVMEMTQEELQTWIRKEVEKSKMVDRTTEKRCQLRLEKQRAGLAKLTQSVADCEVTIQQLYSLLGWDYRDEDSEAEDELQRKPASRDGGPIQSDEKPKLKHKLVPSEATSTRPEIDCPQLKCARTRPLATRRRPVVVLKRLTLHEIRSSVRPPSPKPHDIGGCSDDDHDGGGGGGGGGGDDDDDYDDDDDDDDDDGDKDWGLATGCDLDLSSDDSWKEMTTTHARKSKTLSQRNAKDKAKIRSKTFTAARQKGDASQKGKSQTHSHTSADKTDKKQSTTATVENMKRNPAEEQSGGKLMSSVSQSCIPGDSIKPPTLPEQKIRLNMKVLARCKARKWLPGEIVDIISKEGGEGFKYKVSLEEKRRILVSGHHLAFENIPLLGRLYVGARVLTKYSKDDNDDSFFYSGILGELPSRKNRMRFLVFLDDLTPTYVGLPFLRLVCRPLEDPSADITEDAHQGFIREYLKVWPYPLMAHYCVDQKLNVECEGIQKACKVVQLDCSLVLVLFKHSGHKEWLYRGSMRLEYMVNMKKAMQEKASTEEKSAVKPSVAPTVDYTAHTCSPACLKQVRPKACALVALHKGNPLLVPTTYKFRRIKKKLSPDTATTCVPEETKPSYSIYYNTPCGRTLRTIAQVEEYLHETHCDFLSVDSFSMDPDVSFTAATSLPYKMLIPDLAFGLENKPVPCVNERNEQQPYMFEYRSARNTNRVGLDASLDFLTGCGCIDGCRDSESCSCRQLTTQSTHGKPGEENSGGYTQKRLNRAVVTGVYECNTQCRCDPRMCSNRVAQHGIQVRLLIFMTRDRDWGVRCQDDIPGGTFVCSYSGRVVLGNKKNMVSNTHYVALNHMERVELYKEDYETETYHSDTETDNSSDEEYHGRSGGGANNKHPTNVVASKQTEVKDPSVKRTKRPMVPMTMSRSFFDGEDRCYIVDANKEGNVACFLNHSCSPNLFKQYVFVDTHDLRFPWVTFFTSKRIKAGTELTWDYRSVKDDAETVLGQPCRCGSENCSSKL